MINEIYINGELVLTDNPKKKFKQGYKIRCIICSNLIKRKYYDKKILDKPYECKKCVLKTKNPMHNPDVRKKHNDIIKSKEYCDNMRKLTTGKKNGFYGKTHTQDTIDKIIKANIDYWNNMTDDDYTKVSKRCSKIQKNLLNNNPVDYKRKRAKAARVSHKSQFSNKKMNKIEKTVYDYLNSLGLNFDYSPILASYQYDFIIRNRKILIEVDGDYWHGNPKYYNIDGTDGKRKLNEIQLSKIDRDKEKTEWAKSRGFKLIRIWEDEINNNSYKDKLNEIKKN